MGIRIERGGSGIMRVVFTPEGHRLPLLTGAVFTRLEELLVPDAVTLEDNQEGLPVVRTSRRGAAFRDPPIPLTRR